MRNLFDTLTSFELKSVTNPRLGNGDQIMFIRKLLIAGVAAGTCTIAFAQDYFDFGKIPGVPDRPAVQVDLNPMLLGLASAAARSENPAAADLLAGVKGVRLRVYSSLEDVGDVVKFVDRTSGQLEKEKWQPIVTVQDDSQVRIFVRGDTETVTGVTAMIVGDNKAVFINVTGSISAAQLAQSIKAMNSGKLLASLGGINAAGVNVPASH
jgi:Domain of unknown function (DUF4252)